MMFLLAFVLIAAQINEYWEPVELAKGRVDVPIAANITRAIEPVSLKPHSEFKYANVVRQTYDYSCGSAALTTVLNFYLGQPVDERQTMEGMLEHGEKAKIEERRGFSLLDMKRYVASLGFKGAGFRGEFKDLVDLKQPAIVPITYAEFKHFVVLRGIKDGHVFLADPALGNISLTTEDFLRYWENNVLFLVYANGSAPGSNRMQLTDADLRIMDMDRMSERGYLEATQHWRILERAIDAEVNRFHFNR